MGHKYLAIYHRVRKLTASSYWPEYEEIPLVILDCTQHINTKQNTLEWYAKHYDFKLDDIYGVWFNMVPYDPVNGPKKFLTEG
jgi:hypothetical protein